MTGRDHCAGIKPAPAKPPTPSALPSKVRRGFALPSPVFVSGDSGLPFFPFDCFMRSFADKSESWVKQHPKPPRRIQSPNWLYSWGCVPHRACGADRSGITSFASRAGRTARTSSARWAERAGRTGRAGGSCGAGWSCWPRGAGRVIFFGHSLMNSSMLIDEVKSCSRTVYYRA